MLLESLKHSFEDKIIDKCSIKITYHPRRKKKERLVTLKWPLINKVATRVDDFESNVRLSKDIGQVGVLGKVKVWISLKKTVGYL